MVSTLIKNVDPLRLFDLNVALTNPMLYCQSHSLLPTKTQSKFDPEFSSSLTDSGSIPLLADHALCYWERRS